MNEKENNELLSDIPTVNDRYIVLDTETTGLNYGKDNIISIAGVEIINGRLTGMQYQGYIRPRIQMGEDAIKVHKLNNNFYEENFKDTYLSDKQIMVSFLNFIGSSMVFAHNANFDYNFITKELKYWKLPVLPIERYRCTMKIYKKIFLDIDPSLTKKLALHKCCEYFSLRSIEQNFHSAIFDAFMCAKLVCALFDFQKSNSSKKAIDRLNNKAKEINQDFSNIVNNSNNNNNNNINDVNNNDNDSIDDMILNIEDKITDFINNDIELNNDNILNNNNDTNNNNDLNDYEEESANIYNASTNYNSKNSKFSNISNKSNITNKSTALSCSNEKLLSNKENFNTNNLLGNKRYNNSNNNSNNKPPALKFENIEISQEDLNLILSD